MSYAGALSTKATTSNRILVWREGSKTPLHCRQHVEKGAVNIASRRSVHEGCSKLALVEGGEADLQCQQHVGDEPVGVYFSKGHAELDSWNHVHSFTSVARARFCSPHSTVCVNHTEPGSERFRGVNYLNRRSIRRSLEACVGGGVTKMADAR